MNTAMHFAILSIPNCIFIRAKMKNTDQTWYFPHLKYNSPDPDACIYFIHTPFSKPGPHRRTKHN